MGLDLASRSREGGAVWDSECGSENFASATFVVGRWKLRKFCVGLVRNITVPGEIALSASRRQHPRGTGWRFGSTSSREIRRGDPRDEQLERNDDSTGTRKIEERQNNQKLQKDLPPAKQPGTSREENLPFWASINVDVNPVGLAPIT